ncbi:hypothetical protein GCM10009414_08250 [Tatumella terrea]
MNILSVLCDRQNSVSGITLRDGATFRGKWKVTSVKPVLSVIMPERVGIIPGQGDKNSPRRSRRLQIHHY